MIYRTDIYCLARILKALFSKLPNNLTPYEPYIVFTSLWLSGCEMGRWYMLEQLGGPQRCAKHQKKNLCLKVANRQALFSHFYHHKEKKINTQNRSIQRRAEKYKGDITDKVIFGSLILAVPGSWEGTNPILLVYGHFSLHLVGLLPLVDKKNGLKRHYRLKHKDNQPVSIYLLQITTTT